mmetsp:Transcript_47717/g.94833  ORF Transcript_47717/g.94833 Transcript_47717/m.94833 type:complete len:503 (+) Transcript_47717:78-1586(+)
MAFGGAARSCSRWILNDRKGYLRVVGQDRSLAQQDERRNSARWLRRAGAAALLAAGLLAVTAVVRGPRGRPDRGRPQDAAVRVAAPDLRGLEAQACDCGWAKPKTCQGHDSTGCWQHCCSHVKKMHHLHGKTSSHEATTTVGNSVKVKDGGEDVCGHRCTCNWANAFVCGNHGGNCCAKYCCRVFHEHAVPMPVWTSTTTTTERAIGSTTTVTMKPVMKKCNACTCDCAWTQRWPCKWDDTKQTCCGTCCCGPRPNSTSPKGVGVTGRGGRSLWCWVLMRPPPCYETSLIRFQFSSRVGIFSCDGYAVYSNQSLPVGNATTTRVVNSDLVCSSGGEFKTALNLNIFMTVWNKVIADGDYARYDWTVKVDPDSVFYPERLRLAVFEYGSGNDKVYLNNCKFGLHGPIEVFSRTAVQAWASGRGQCNAHFNKLCSGDCFWGEDMFIDQCMSRVLKVRRDSDYSLLVEEHCDAPKDWADCTDKSFVAYHPFKDVNTWRTCWSKAK